MNNDAIGTVADVHAAFAEWQRRWLSGELDDAPDIDDLTTDEYGVLAGDYFISILEELV